MFGHEEPETSDFASQGFEAVRNTYLDSLQLATLVYEDKWSDARLSQQIADYEEFLQSPDLMKHARLYGKRNLAHMKFERDSRLGKYTLTYLDFKDTDE